MKNNKTIFTIYPLQVSVTTDVSDHKCICLYQPDIDDPENGDSITLSPEQAILLSEKLQKIADKIIAGDLYNG